MFPAEFEFAEAEFAGGIGGATEALVGAGEEEMGVGVAGVATDGLFEVLGGGFELALLKEDAAEFEMGAGGGGFGFDGLCEDAGGVGETALAEEKCPEIDAGVVGGGGAEGDGAAKVMFGVGVAAEGEVVEASGAMDASRGGGREGEVEGGAGEFVLAEGVAVAGEVVAAIDGWFLQSAGAEEGGFSLGETVGGDAREAEAAPGLGIRGSEFRFDVSGEGRLGGGEAHGEEKGE